MATIERYVRVGMTQEGSWPELELHCGLELREGDKYTDLVWVLFDGVKQAVEFSGSHVEIIEEFERWVTECFPGRAFFAETDQDGKGIQVYQPYGMPRTDLVTMTGCQSENCWYCGPKQY